MDLPHSSERRALLALLLLALGASGCVRVKPHEKELLADPAMTYGSGGEADTQEEHVLNNREGTAGARGGDGGGCGCN